ncbi:MAG TPA: tetratricopeptide repeat protein [Anaerolineae bacterium]|nr:tetratricopeptide repeat protein [Anaerolineae bacterium]
MTHLWCSRFKNLLWITLLLLSLTHCNRIAATPPPSPEIPIESQVGQLSANKTALAGGETTDIRVAVVKVLGAEDPFEYQWSTTGGVILVGQGTCCINYQAPDTPGAYEVQLTVRHNNQSVLRSIALQIAPPPTPTAEPTATFTPAPPANPTATPLPTDIPLPDAIAHFQRAEDYYFKRDYERTIADYTRAIELNYDPLSDPYYNRGYVYYVQQDYTQAIADFSKAIELNYDPASVPYYNRANAHYYKGNNDQAIADYTKAIELQADPLSWVYNNRGLAYRKRGEYDLAIADYTKAIELKHEPPQWPFFNRANAYADKGDYDRAINDYNEALRLDPSIVDAYYQRGLAYKNKGDLNAAITDFKKVLELAQDSLRDDAAAQLQELGAP